MPDPSLIVLADNGRHRSVTERLSDRCDELQAAVDQLLHNETILIAKVGRLEAAIGTALAPTEQPS